jgi:glycolate oxidase FAD binding subunit
VAAEFGAASAACDAVAAAANSQLVPSAVELSRSSPGGPLLVGVLVEGSQDGAAARASRMAELLSPGESGSAAEVSAAAPPWWPGPPEAGDGTLIRVSFWVSALGGVLDAIDEAARVTGVSPRLAGSAGAGVLHVSCPPEDPAAAFVGALRGGLEHGRGAVVVLTAPAAVRDALAADGGMAGTHQPALSLMRAVKDQFDPSHRMAPGRFPEGI